MSQRHQESLLVYQRHPDIGVQKDQGSAKVARSHAKNRKGMFVQLNTAAHYTGIILKMGMPVRVSENDVR